ncbi:MAG TPA: OmpA family protein [Acidisphaera sp.]|nr:OmpA family protein [Acidisphaera sp.]
MRRTLSVTVLLLTAIVFAPARAADAGPFIVFFTSWSALIDQPAHDTVVAAAAAAKLSNAPVRVTGFASTVGSAEANKLLSQLRAQVVADELVADGVDAKRITLTGVGPTSFMADPLEARRVRIEVGGN